MKLPRIHAIGCDTTSYLYNVGKVRVLKKLVDDRDKLDLLDGFGETEFVSPEIEEKRISRNSFKWFATEGKVIKPT